MCNKVWVLESLLISNSIHSSFPMSSRFIVLTSLAVTNHKKFSLLGIYLIQIQLNSRNYLRELNKAWRCLIELSSLARRNNLRFMASLATLLLTSIKTFSIALTHKCILQVCIVGSLCISLWKNLSCYLRIKSLPLTFGEITHNLRYGMNGPWVYLIQVWIR